MSLPIYDLDDFVYKKDIGGFYSNAISTHFKVHSQIVKGPRVYTFYVGILFTGGRGIFEIDFNKYTIKPGTVFMLTPGQVRNIDILDEIEGNFFFHTKEFYELHFTHEKIDKYPFYASILNTSQIIIPKTDRGKIEGLFHEINMAYQVRDIMRFQKICALLNLLYIELTRIYIPIKARIHQNHNQLSILKKLEDCIEAHYRRIKLPKDYASMLNMTPKHLNRIVKASLNKTVTDLISDRVILEAKRLLIYSTLSVSQIADELGYEDSAYFFRLFKKKTGLTPVEFSLIFHKEQNTNFLNWPQEI